MLGTGVDAMADLGTPFKLFYDHEAGGAEYCSPEERHGALALAPLHGGNRHGGGETAGEQNSRVRGTHDPVKLGTPCCKFVRIAFEIHRVEQKQPAKEQQFGKQEQPHAELGAEVILMLVAGHLSTPLKSYGP